MNCHVKFNIIIHCHWFVVTGDCMLLAGLLHCSQLNLMNKVWKNLLWSLLKINIFSSWRHVQLDKILFWLSMLWCGWFTSLANASMYCIYWRVIWGHIRSDDWWAYLMLTAYIYKKTSIKNAQGISLATWRIWHYLFKWF